MVKCCCVVVNSQSFGFSGCRQNCKKRRIFLLHQR